VEQGSNFFSVLLLDHTKETLNNNFELRGKK
jgi:hypothetical protein